MADTSLGPIFEIFNLLAVVGGGALVDRRRDRRLAARRRPAPAAQLRPRDRARAPALAAAAGPERGPRPGRGRAARRRAPPRRPAWRVALGERLAAADARRDLDRRARPLGDRGATTADARRRERGRRRIPGRRVRGDRATRRDRRRPAARDSRRAARRRAVQRSADFGALLTELLARLPAGAEAAWTLPDHARCPTARTDDVGRSHRPGRDVPRLAPQPVAAARQLGRSDADDAGRLGPPSR